MSHTILAWSIIVAQVFLAVAMALAAFRMFRGPRAQECGCQGEGIPDNALHLDAPVSARSPAD